MNSKSTMVYFTQLIIYNMLNLVAPMQRIHKKRSTRIILKAVQGLITAVKKETTRKSCTCQH